MAKYAFKNISFVTSATKPSGYPTFRDSSGYELPEIAIAGRSNVGKSTLLNHLFRNKYLVKTSTTPGKTQLLNFFNIDSTFICCDLPGYGYARVPHRVRSHWGTMIKEYLEERKSLKLILFLIDIRRIPNDDDIMFLEWAARAEKSVIIVITKVDKVKSNEKSRNTQKILGAFDAENLHYVHYSATKNIGYNQLVAMINEALNEEIESVNSDQ